MTRHTPLPTSTDATPFTHLDANLSPSETIAAFRKRQEEDLIRRRKPFVQRLEEGQARRTAEWIEGYEEGGESEAESERSGEEGWKNSEGERLADFGVDEEVEFYDEDDLPLSELMARRRLRDQEEHVG
jgi:palmitoyltransferase